MTFCIHEILWISSLQQHDLHMVSFADDFIQLIHDQCFCYT